MTFHAPALLAFDIGVIEGRAIEALRYGIADEELLLVSASYAAAINLALGLMASARPTQRMAEALLPLHVVEVADGEITEVTATLSHYFVQRWAKREQGYWGLKPDGWSLHLNGADCGAFIRDSRRDLADDYDAPMGDLYSVPVSLLTVEEILAVHRSANGVRYHDRNYPEHRDAG